MWTAWILAHFRPIHVYTASQQMRLWFHGRSTGTYCKMGLEYNRGRGKPKEKERETKCKVAKTKSSCVRYCMMALLTSRRNGEGKAGRVKLGEGSGCFMFTGRHCKYEWNMFTAAFVNMKKAGVQFFQFTFSDYWF